MMYPVLSEMFDSVDFDSVDFVSVDYVTMVQGVFLKPVLQSVDCCLF